MQTLDLCIKYLSYVALILPTENCKPEQGLWVNTLLSFFLTYKLLRLQDTTQTFVTDSDVADSCMTVIVNNDFIVEPEIL